jgi:chromosome segregation ATPase
MKNNVLPPTTSNDSSPSKRIQHALGTIRQLSNSNHDSSSNPAGLQTPQRTTEEVNEHQDVDSQVSISTNLDVNKVTVDKDDDDDILSTSEDPPTTDLENDNTTTTTVQQQQQETSHHKTDPMNPHEKTITATTKPDDTSSKMMEMIGDLTEQVKSLTTTINLIPTLQTDIQRLSTQLSANTTDLSKQVADLNAKVLVHEEAIEELKSKYETDRQYMTSHVKPAIKKLEKAGLIDNISNQLLDKITSNETSIAELKLSSETNDLDKTLNLGLNEQEMDTIARLIQSLEDDDSPLGALKKSFANTENDIANLLKADKIAFEWMQKMEQRVAKLSNNITSNDNIKENNNKKNIDNKNKNNNEHNKNNNEHNKNKNNAPAEHQTCTRCYYDWRFEHQKDRYGHDRSRNNTNADTYMSKLMASLRNRLPA